MGALIRKLFLIGIVVLLAGCWGQESVKILPGKGVVAVGAKMDLVVLDGCSQDSFDVSMSGRGKLPTNVDLKRPTCARTNMQKMRSLSWGDDTVFDVESNRFTGGTISITVKARKAGRSKLEITVDTSCTSSPVDRHLKVSGRRRPLDLQGEQLGALAGAGDRERLFGRNMQRGGAGRALHAVLLYARGAG